ncbi:hypothetical protein [Occultella kanbiaonis]|uniref:hypothetical protein n=1 Tax=Occultella kanbiaonis TaxID=2675754 RepID=UPI0012B82CF6|nr:hypothetical protein [Occultella kanbiaonis]
MGGADDGTPNGPAGAVPVTAASGRAHLAAVAPAVWIVAGLALIVAGTLAALTVLPRTAAAASRHPRRRCRSG